MVRTNKTNYQLYIIKNHKKPNQIRLLHTPSFPISSEGNTQQHIYLSIYLSIYLKAALGPAWLWLAKASLLPPLLVVLVTTVDEEVIGDVLWWWCSFTKWWLWALLLVWAGFRVAAASIRNFHLHSQAIKKDTMRITIRLAIQMAKMMIPLNVSGIGPMAPALPSSPDLAVKAKWKIITPCTIDRL